MRIENKNVFYKTSAMRRFWTEYYLRRAWDNLAKKQLEDELRYTEGILGLNNIRIVFSETLTKPGSGRRLKDFVYGYWTEEDIRIKLASELSAIPHCQVHGQVHIHGKTNRKGRSNRSRSHIHKYPDLLFLVLKLKERGFSKERNIEVAAIELKYYSGTSNERDLERSIKGDLNKIVYYLKGRGRPRVSAGYFLCIDESQKCKAILKRLIKKGQYIEYPIGVGVIVPRYAKLGMQYPAELEKYNQGTMRKICYILDYVRGKLRNHCFYRRKPPEEYKEYKKYGLFCYLGKKGGNYIEIVNPKYVSDKNDPYWSVMLKLDSDKKHRANSIFYEWSNKNNKYNRVKKLSKTALIDTINKKSLRSIDSLEKIGEKIVKRLKIVTRGI